jgi:hypothetical protein
VIDLFEVYCASPEAARDERAAGRANDQSFGFLVHKVINSDAELAGKSPCFTGT